MSATAPSLSADIDLLEISSQVAAKMRGLGLNVSVWDPFGQSATPFEPSVEFCRLAQTGSADCPAAISAVVGRVLADGEPDTARSPCGCCVVGVPIHRRRRLLGAVVACFPPREMLDEECLARTCDRLRLDRTVAGPHAARSCRHGADEADDFLQVLAWVVRHEQDDRDAHTELADLSSSLSTAYEELSLVYRISRSMRVTSRREGFLRNICDELADVMQCAVAAVVYAHSPGQELDVIVTAGPDALEPAAVMQLAEEVVAPELAMQEGRLLRNTPLEGASVAAGEVRNLAAVSLGAAGEQTGVLIGLNRPGGFHSSDLKLMDSIGGHAAVFLANNRLYADMEGLLTGVLHALTETIDAKDPYTSGHSERVALLARRIAEASGYSTTDAQRIFLAGLLHDIGKVGVPESILCKEGPLTEAEFKVIRRHPTMGARILSGIPQLDDVIPGVLSHHERPDGRGYPKGLIGDAIPTDGLIVGLADCFDAMISHRTYRGALSIEAALAEIRRHSGKQFHEGLVGVFLSLDIEQFVAEMHAPVKTVFPAGASGGGT